MNPIEWLSAKAAGFDALSAPERDAILHFALLWSFFEARVLHTHASAESIARAAKQWGADGRLDAAMFKEVLLYFRGRYYRDGAFTEHFADLGFKPRDKRALVEAVLKGENANLGDTAAALLIVIYRLRNNLFHGVKWAYGIRGQQDNFENANALLMSALELHGEF
jgi:hypothetical protein